jgi:hypothetical protein
MNVRITNKQVRARIFLPFVSHYHDSSIACASLLTSRPLNRSRRESGLTNRDLMLIPILSTAIKSCGIWDAIRSQKMVRNGLQRLPSRLAIEAQQRLPTTIARSSRATKPSPNETRLAWRVLSFLSSIDHKNVICACKNRPTVL